MNINEKLIDLLMQVDAETDEENVAKLGDEIWSITDKISEGSDPDLVETLIRASNSKASTYFINNIVIALGNIATENAIQYLETIAEEYKAIDYGIHEKAKEVLAIINPTKYMSDLYSDTKYQIIRQKCKASFSAEVMKIIEGLTEGISLVNDMNMTMMWIALDIDNLELCKYLLDRGVDMEHQNTFGETALDYARKIDNTVASYLLYEYA